MNRPYGREIGLGRILFFAAQKNKAPLRARKTIE
jgi:hypothetical protein